VPSYIRSNCNRFYAAIESSYGIAAPVTTTDRFPALGLRAQQTIEPTRRLDKTGTRTLLWTSRDGRRRTAFEVRSYLSTLSPTGQVPCGVLFQSAMGATPEISQGLLVDTVIDSNSFSTTTPHGWNIGSGVSIGQEIRFVSSVASPQQVAINAPFSQPLVSGIQLSSTITYRLATALPSISIYDYWDPVTAVSRILNGAAVDVLQLSVNGDQHMFAFSGLAADLIDSVTLIGGNAGLTSFPNEPVLALTNGGAVPGHLGQAWLGSTTRQFFTVLEASIRLQNNLELRNHEFGSSYPRAAVAGQRQVSTSFSLYAQDDTQTLALYSAAKTQTPISIMLQMGKQKGQLMGAYLPSVVPVLPTFDDSETRLRWQFNNNLAQGTSDDELYIAFA
jgi:hypothetical protein